MTQIKSRLKAAYENVEFYASNTWVHGSNAFQRANQELYVRESKVKDILADEPSRPRTVLDNIPQSRLAQYANYEYNEARELCYASSATNISFYYPCICRRSSIKEPWMIPEVEQLFIWFSYAPDFNILEFLRLEELGHTEEQEKLKVGRDCRWHDFHEISPIFYETFERTPGKSRYTSCPPILPSDFSKFVPSQVKIQTFEDMILRMKIKSDNVKYLWSDHSRHITETIVKETKLNLLKSPLGNYFLLENVDPSDSQYEKEEVHKIMPTVDDHHLKSTDFGYLQGLADSLRVLEALIFNTAKQSMTNLPLLNTFQTTENVPKIEVAPTRRLYSAVLQGLAADKKQSNSIDVLTSINSVGKEQASLSVPSISPAKTATGSCFSTEHSSITALTALTPIHKSTPILSKNHISSITSPSQWLTHSSHWGTPSSSTKSYAQVSQEKTKYTSTQTNFTSCKHSTYVNTDVTNMNSKPTNATIASTYSNSCAINTISNTSSVSCSPMKTGNTPDYTVYAGNTYGNLCFNSNHNYCNNSYHSTSQYPSNFQNSSCTGATFSNNIFTNNTYQSTQASSMSSRNVFPQFNRQQYPSNQPHVASPHSMWFIQQSRPSALYSVAHFTTQPYLLLPPPPPSPPPPPASPVAIPSRQNQRWVPPTHFVRTASTLQSYHIPVTPQSTSSPLSQQQWGTQNQSLYRTNSNQQIPLSSQFLDSLSGQSPRTKSKPKKNLTTQISFLQHEGRSRSPEGSSVANEHLDNIDVLSGTYSNMSMSNTNRSSAGSSEAFSLPASEKTFLIKSAASTSSLDCRKIKVYNNYKDDEHTGVEKRASAVVLGTRNVHSNFFARDSEELHTLLPISASISEELERQALEQYQHSDDNFYQELERQAEEQYNQDHSENWIGPPNEILIFGGQTGSGCRKITEYCWLLFCRFQSWDEYHTNSRANLMSVWPCEHSSNLSPVFVMQPTDGGITGTAVIL